MHCSQNLQILLFQLRMSFHLPITFKFWKIWKLFFLSKFPKCRQATPPPLISPIFKDSKDVSHLSKPHFHKCKLYLLYSKIFLFKTNTKYHLVPIQNKSCTFLWESYFISKQILLLSFKVEDKIFMNFELVSIQQSNLEQINKYIMCEKDFFLNTT